VIDPSADIQMQFKIFDVGIKSHGMSSQITFGDLGFPT